MNFSNRNIFLLVILALTFACTAPQKAFVKYSNPQITYSGRIDSSQVNAAKFYWSGTSVKLNFKGESISALFKDEKGDNYYNIIVDKEDPFIFRPDTIKGYYQLASKLSKGKHTVEIFKRTEWSQGKTTFYGFQINGDAKLMPKDPPFKRKIEFYGNSITAGYAVEDLSGKDSPDSTYTNNYLSYAAITARHFNADYHCICKSGIGLTVSWFPLIMPEMYNRLKPTDPKSKWDFSLYSPDIVVINLLQNDSWLVNMTKSKEFKMRFGNKTPTNEYIVNAYQKFVSKIRNHYPNANIICSLGSMNAAKEDSKWIDHIKTAVANLHDKKVYTHFLPYQESPGHPSIKGQKEMANSLIAFINKNIEW
jgi:lysophospholipase L1-like esterase